MLQRMRLSTKLIGGFLLVAAIATIIGIIGFSSIGTISNYLKDIANVKMPGVEELLKTSEGLANLRVAQRTLMNPQLDRDGRRRQYEHLHNYREQYLEGFKKYSDLPKSAEEVVLNKEFIKNLEEWRKENDKFLEMSKELDKIDVLNPDALKAQLELFRGDHYKAMNLVGSMLFTNKTFEGGESDTACNFGKWITAIKTENPRIQAIINEVKEDHHHFHQLVKEAKKLVAEGRGLEAQDIYLKGLADSAEKVFGYLRDLRKEAESVQNYYQQMNNQAMVVVREKQNATLKVLRELIASNNKSATTARDESLNAANSSRVTMLVTVGIGVSAAVFLGIFLALGITRPIIRIIENLNSGSEQTTAAANQVSTSSQQLSQGATEQASALEETSSSLDEIASMTKSNSENAGKANQLASDARNSAEKGDKAMKELQNAMSGITESSQKVSNIIKTIEEIAFQTNLLALNAAVEAARAGEHGKGFAVVAEEVRNLAQRAGVAAKDTSQLIEESSNRTKEGSGICDSAAAALTEIIEGAKKVADIVGEIAAASKEQADGIGQVTSAVSQMDQVTQQNAATSEETAAAAEELSSQADNLQDMVAQLQQIVGGTSSASDMKAVHHASSGGWKQHHAIGAPAHHIHTGPARKIKAAIHKGPQTLDPEEVIPLGDEDDF